MVYLNVRHTVADYEKWRPIFDADEARRRTAGAKGVNQVYRDVSDVPTRSLLLWNGTARKMHSSFWMIRPWVK